MRTKRVSPLEMSGEEFREAGHEIVERIAEFIDSIGQRKVTTGESPDDILRITGTPPLPQEGKPAKDIIMEVAGLLTGHSLFNGHPKFMGYVTSSAAPAGALADLLAAAVNPNVGANILSPSATEMEKQTIKWLAEMIGLDASYGGVLVSGGNMANFTGFLAARTAKAPESIKETGLRGLDNQMVFYCSDATHTWIEKAANLFGFGTSSIRWIKTSADNRIEISLLEDTIKNDTGKGLVPFMVVGNAGDVSTGAVDDLNSIAGICKKYNLWFHVDGAYGLPAIILPEYKELFAGVEKADSIAIDPHKWLYAPLEAGCTLVKNPETLVHTFSSHPSYYKFDATGGMPALNFYEYGFQNSRGFRALKVWTALQQAGLNGYKKMIGEDIRLSQRLSGLVAASPELEAVTQNLSISNFRYVPKDHPDDEQYLNRLNEELLTVLQKNGDVFLSNALVKGRFCLRACIVNFRTSEKDIEEIVDIVLKEGRELHKEQLKNIFAA